MAFCHHLLGRAFKPLKTTIVTIIKPKNLYPSSQHTLLWVFSLDLLSSGESTFMLNGGGWMKLKYFETSVPRLVCLVKSKTRKQKSLERDIWLSNAKFVGDLKPRANDATLLDVTCCVRLQTLLHVFGCCWELLYPFEHHYNTDASTRNIVGATMLGVVVSVCTPLQHRCINTQHCWRNNVGSCLVSKKVA